MSSPSRLFTHGYTFGHVLWQEDHCLLSLRNLKEHFDFRRPHLAGLSWKLQWKVEELLTDSSGSGNLVHWISSWLVMKYTSGSAKIESINLRNPVTRWGRLRNLRPTLRCRRIGLGRRIPGQYKLDAGPVGSVGRHDR